MYCKPKMLTIYFRGGEVQTLVLATALGNNWIT